MPLTSLQMSVHMCACVCVKIEECAKAVACCCCFWSGTCGGAGSAPTKMQLFPSVDREEVVRGIRTVGSKRGEEEGNFLKVPIYKRAFI